MTNPHSFIVSCVRSLDWSKLCYLLVSTNYNFKMLETNKTLSYIEGTKFLKTSRLLLCLKTNYTLVFALLEVLRQESPFSALFCSLSS